MPVNVAVPIGSVCENAVCTKRFVREWSVVATNLNCDCCGCCFRDVRASIRRQKSGDFLHYLDCGIVDSGFRRSFDVLGRGYRGLVYGASAYEPANG